MVQKKNSRRRIWRLLKIDETISQKLDKIIEKIEQQDNGKKFKSPVGFFGRQKLKNKSKDYCIVQILRTNGNVEFKVMRIEDNVIKLDNESFHEASADYIMRYKRYPLIILPEWNIKPLSNKVEPFKASDNFNEATKEGTLTSTEKFILNRIHADLIKPKSSINIWVVLIGLAVVGGVVWLLNYLKIIK